MTSRAAAIVAAVVVVVGVGATRFMGRRPTASAQKAPAADLQAEEVAVPVEAAEVRRGLMVRALAVTGTLKTDRDIQVTSKIAGRVAVVAVKEGDRVRAGQTVVVLDDGDLKAQVAQAEASLRAWKERLAQALAGESVRYTQTDAQIQQAEANLQAAQVRVQQLEAAARVTDASAKAQVARAESNLKSAQDRLRMVREGARRQERRQAENAVAQARANLETTKARVERRRQLFAQGAISREELDENEKMLRLAEAQYSSAVEQRDLVEEGARTEEVRIAEEQVRQAEEGLREARASLERTRMSHDDVAAARSQVKQLEAALKVAQANRAQYQIVPRETAAIRASVAEAQAKLDYAREMCGYARIVSPVDGVVSACSVNAGESITTMTTLMNIVALSGVYFEAQVPELSLSQVTPGLPVEVSVASIPGKTFRGTVRELIPVASTDGKSFRVRVSVPSDGRLPVGSFARGQIRVGQDASALLVPKESILSLAGESFVFRLVDGRARRQPVRVGLTDAANAQILSGLRAGDRVVTSGVALLTDGARIEVAAPGARRAK